MTVFSVALSVGLCALCMSLVFSGETTGPMPIWQQWFIAIVLAAVIPALVAPIVLWRIQSLIEALDKANFQLQRLANTDPLTGLLNRRGFEDAANALLGDSSAATRSIAVLLCDIDQFKLINDTYGHDFGDHAIRHVSEQIARNHLTPGAIAGRFGGEEFALLLPDASLGQAKMIAEQIRIACSLPPVEANSLVAHVTVSIGVISVHRVESGLWPLMKQADLALYAAKRGGRNKVVAGPVEPVAHAA